MTRNRGGLRIDIDQTSPTMEWMDPVQGQVATGNRGKAREGSYPRMSFVKIDRNPSDLLAFGSPKPTSG